MAFKIFMFLLVGTCYYFIASLLCDNGMVFTRRPDTIFILMWLLAACYLCYIWGREAARDYYQKWCDFEKLIEEMEEKKIEE